METSPNQTSTQLPMERKDAMLWNMAKKRASFKWSLMTYFVMNLFFIAVWYYTGSNAYFWPVWPALGWGIGIAFHYFSAYHGDRLFTAEEEYQKLKNKHNP